MVIDPKTIIYQYVFILCAKQQSMVSFIVHTLVLHPCGSLSSILDLVNKPVQSNNCVSMLLTVSLVNGEGGYLVI